MNMPSSWRLNAEFLDQKPEAEDILEHLEHVIRLLRSYSNYEIAFVSESQRNISLPTVDLEMRGGHNAGIITLDMENRFSYNYLIVTEATVASAFDDYFLDLWEKVTPKFKDKEYIIVQCLFCPSIFSARLSRARFF